MSYQLRAYNRANAASIGIPCSTPVPILEGDEISSNGVNFDTVGIMGHYVRIVGIRYVILR